MIDRLGDIDWSTAAQVSTTVGTLVALVGVVVGLVMNVRSERLTREGQELERAQAEATAARSEAAAALTEEYTSRAITALETMARGGDPAGTSAPRGVSWSLTHHSGDSYLLTNSGDARARHVSVSADETLILRPFEPRDLEAGEAVTFIAAASMATRDMTITVTWQDLDAELRQWRYPLPPRPPR